MSQEPVPEESGGPPPSPAAPASLGVRIGARLLDVLLIAIPASIILAIAGIGTAGFGMRGWVGSAIMSVLWFGYFVWFESNQGATVGKRLLKLKVVAADGSPASMEMTAKRNVWMLFGLIPFLGGLLSLVAVIVIMVTISSGADNRGFHDTFADTAVMRS